MADTYTLKNGNTIRVVPFGPAEIRELFELKVSPDEERIRTLMRKAVPDASAADFECLIHYALDVGMVLQMAAGMSSPFLH